MTVRTLFDNLGGNPGTGSGGPNFVLGTPFNVAYDITLTHFGFYRPDTTGNVVPTKFSLYDRSNSAQLIQEFNAESGSGPGWVWTALPQNYAATAGQTLIVAALYPYQASWGRVSAGNRPTAPAGITWPTNYRGYKSSADMVYPDTYDTNSMEAISVKYDDPGTIPDPDTVAGIDLSNLMTAWLAAGSSNTHTLDLPWQTRAAVSTLTANVSTLAGDVSTLLGRVTSARATAIDTIATSVGTGLSGKVDDIVTSVGSGLNALVQAHKDAWDLWRGINANIWDDVQGALNASGQFWGKIGQATGLTPITYAAKLVGWLGSLGRGAVTPAGDWVQDATTPLTGQLAWLQPADLYLISFTTPPSNAVGNTVDGVSWLGHMLWWAEWDGNQAGERHFLDFPAGFCDIPGRRMPGILIKTNGPCNGTVAAWSYTAP